MAATNRKIDKHKLINDIYFNKKQRSRLKKVFLEIQKNILVQSDTETKPLLKSEYKQRETQMFLLEISVKALDAIKRAEEFYNDTYLTKCRFELYKKNGSVLIKTNFYKPFKNENKISFVYFPKGLPKKTIKKAFFFKNNFGLNQYELIDQGKFKQKILNFNEMRINFSGSKINYKILFKIIDREKLIYWARLEK